jgi:hypothetical protein
MRWYSSVTRNLVASAARDELSQVAGVPTPYRRRPDLTRQQPARRPALPLA